MIYSEGGGISTQTIVAIVVPISLAIVLLVVGFCIARRPRKPYFAIMETSGKL